MNKRIKNTLTILNSDNLLSFEPSSYKLRYSKRSLTELDQFIIFPTKLWYTCQTRPINNILNWTQLIFDLSNWSRPTYQTKSNLGSLLKPNTSTVHFKFSRFDPFWTRFDHPLKEIFISTLFLYLFKVNVTKSKLKKYKVSSQYPLLYI